MRSIDEQVAILMRGVDYGDDRIRETMEAELRERLKEGRPLRVYLGVDPSAPDIHLGHTVPMHKLRQFQELGHDVTFLIGNFTGLIGDPSDKEGVRRQMTPDELAANSKTYTDQAFKVLDREKTRVRYNAEWLGKLTFEDVIHLASNFTVQQFLVRDNFRKRYESGDPIWLHEFFYALMQGYDAVAQDTDVQVGGTDQLFNLLAGRKLQEAFGQRPQICITLPILVGTDGRLRMSKSTGNAIGVDAPPEDMYGKVMSLPDDAMPNYFNLVSSFSPRKVDEIMSQVAGGKLHPRDAKMLLARDIVTTYRGEEAANLAEEHFKTVFQQRESPDEMPERRIEGPTGLVDLVADAFEKSKGEARRLIQQGGVRLDGEQVKDIGFVVEPGKFEELRVGKRGFLRLV